MNDVIRANGCLEILADRLAKVFDLAFRNLHFARFGVVIDIGRSDQRKVIFIGNGEDDAAVAVLENETAVMVEETLHHDVAALHQTHVRGAIGPDDPGQHLRNPRPPGVHQHPCRRHPFLATDLIPQGHGPVIAFAARRNAFRSGEDFGTASRCINGVENNKTRIVDPAIRVLKALFEHRLKAGGKRRAIQPDNLGHGQKLAAAKMVVEEQPETQKPRRTQLLVMRKNEPQGPGNMRGRTQEDFTLLERLPDQVKLVILEVAQPAVDQLRGCRRCCACKIPHFRQQDPRAAAHGISCNAGSIDASADHDKIIVRRHPMSPRGLVLHSSLNAIFP